MRLDKILCCLLFRINEIRRKAISIGQSEYYRKLIGAKKCYIMYPGHILNPKYAHCESLTARENLRIELIIDYRGEKFSPNLVIGKEFRAGTSLHIGAINSIVIGDNVTVGSNVLIIDHNHGRYSRKSIDDLYPPQEKHLNSKAGIIIGNNVWIGDGCMILAGVTIGDGAVIGANCVVTHDIIEQSVFVAPQGTITKKYNSDSGWMLC